MLNMVCSIPWHMLLLQTCVLSPAEIGRFELNFDLGLQLRTTRQSALLLYVEAAFALQLLNGEVW